MSSLRVLIALSLLSLCSACLGPNHATARLARFNDDIENRWVKQGAFMLMFPGYIIFGLVGDNLIFNSIYWWTGDNPVDPPKDNSGPKDFGW